MDSTQAQIAAAQAQHRRLQEEVVRLSFLLESGGSPPALKAPWAHLVRSVTCWMIEEEAEVFPDLLAVAGGGDPEAAERLPQARQESGELATLTAACRAAARGMGAQEAALLALLDDLEAHVAAQEALLNDGARPATNEKKSVLRRTSGICPACLAEVPAAVVADAAEVRLEKTCPEHGPSAQRLSAAPAYWRDLDRYYFQVNGKPWPQRDYIVRMTERCNLDCPICLARANTSDTPDLDLSGLESLLSERRGLKVDLMAAEPTLRPDLADWVRRIKARGHVAALHTNGLKLANPKYAQELKEAGVDEVFLQFDGFDEAANRALRGRRLLQARLAALANLRKLDIATSLIVVIGRGLNEAEVGNTVRFALEPENDHVREVFFLGLRLLGSARDQWQKPAAAIEEMAMMPDELIDLLCAQYPGINREDIRRFNKLYFALLSAFRVKKCLYVQHYLLARDRAGGGRPIAQLVDLAAMEKSAENYAIQMDRRPHLARAALLGDLAVHGVNRQTSPMLLDLVRLQNLLRSGMNLQRVPRRFLLLGFITACDPHNYDAQVAVNCGKGELSADGGFTDSSAWANVQREARFARQTPQEEG